MNKEQSEYNLSFAGCGFLGLYHAGVSGCIQEFAPQLYKGQRVSGASAGAIAAAFLVCDVKLSKYVQYLMQIINTARSYLFGPFDPRFKITQHVREGLDLYLPDDAHIICSGNLHISMTNQATQENYVVKNYKDRNELIKAILCSSFIPVFSGFIPLTFRGEWMIDGALTKNMLELDYHTITISPFSGDADICPMDDWGYGQIYIAGTSFLVNPNNIHRIFNIVWPKSPEELGKLAQLGYSDALHFLARKGFIKCNIHKCHSIFMKVKIKPERQRSDERCKKCHKNLKRALQSALSNSILSSFKPIENAVEMQISKYLKLFQHAVTIPITIMSKIIDRCVTLLKETPLLVIGSFLSVMETLLSLDDVFKQSLSKAIESNNKHCYLYETHEALHQAEISANFRFLYDEESDSDDSGESLFDHDDSDMMVLQNINDEDSDEFEDQLTDFKGESDNDFKKYQREIPGANDGKMDLVCKRGEADGEDSETGSVIESGCTVVHSSCDTRFNIDHHITWSCPNIFDNNVINYDNASVIDFRCRHSSNTL